MLSLLARIFPGPIQNAKLIGPDKAILWGFICGRSTTETDKMNYQGNNLGKANGEGRKTGE